MTSPPRESEESDQFSEQQSYKPRVSQDPPRPNCASSSADVKPPAHEPRRRALSISQSNKTAAGQDEGARVFPIRSAVSIDPTPSALPRNETSQDYFAHRSSKASGGAWSPSFGELMSRTRTGDEPIAGRREDASETVPSSAPSRKSSQAEGHFGLGDHGFQMTSDRTSEKASSYRSRSQGGAPSMHSQQDTGGLLTARFKHVITEGGHAVITGRDGDTLQRCEDEPIHVPGAVQSFGALVALREESDGQLVVRAVSENSKRVLGYTPRQLFALDSFTDILSEDQTDNLMDNVDFVRDEETDLETNGPEVFTMAIRDPQRRSHKLWCAIHVSPTNSELVICEFELEDDRDFPLSPLHEETPEPPEDTLNSNPTDDEFRESTESHNRPLRILRSARKQRGEAAAMEVFNLMSQVQEQLAQASNLDQFLKVLVGVTKEMTGFHRVMIYQFDNAANGQVVTELVDPRATKDLYKGLHFPASDIPKQARDMYKINKVRLLYDRDHETSRLVCRTLEDLETPLDLTHSYLRAMSPIHIKYLTNMAVRSSMSISINAFNDLWGLISCHAYGPKGTRVSFPIRKMCRMVGDSASRNIERLSYASRLQARKLINTAPTSKNPSGYIIASSDDLLGLFDADYGLLSIHEETKILGKLQTTQEALALLEYLRMRQFTSVVSSQDIRADFPDLRYSPGFKSIAGLLLVPLTVGGQDFIVFFRQGELKQVKWAGNPYEKFVKEGTEGYLEPRKSFKTWTENVVGKCRQWTEEQMETAGVLCLVYGKFIEVWRQKEQAMQNTALTKLLLQNSAHEVRTPLNAIINYLEIALEGALDQETRDNLSKSHSASKSLIYVINDLLDLTKTESSTQLIHEEAFCPSVVFHEAVDAFANDVRRKNVVFEVIEGPELPSQVLGDPRRIRQAISNITANAVEATTQGSIKVEMVVSAVYEQSVDIEIVIEDTGCGISPSKLDDLFAELEQAQSEPLSMIEETLNPDPSRLPSTDRPAPRQALGLGLAVVARIVRNMNGQLRLKSEEGNGSRFVVVLPFELPASETRQPLHTTISSGSGHSSVTERPHDSHIPGELTLIAKPTNGHGEDVHSPPRPKSLSRRSSHNSVDTLNSGASYSSAQSQKSDVDRLIEAIQEPPRLQGSTSLDSGRKRRKSNLASAQSSTPSSGRQLTRPKSLELPKKTPPQLRASSSAGEGQVEIQDTKTSPKPIKVADDAAFDASTVPSATPTVLSPTEQVQSPTEAKPKESKQLTTDTLRVLVAEDDPINSRIVEKRLQKSGHETRLTVNGEECASQFGENPGSFDVVLMDMQMPIVDGVTSCKMIRSYEKSHPSTVLSSCAAINGRVPIFAVSASLLEQDRQMYIDAGFDGWILKPISFPRLNELIKGIVDQELRYNNVYAAGGWEQGGWFAKSQTNIYQADTQPTDRIPCTDPSAGARKAAETGPEASPHMQEQKEKGMEPKGG